MKRKFYLHFAVLLFISSLFFWNCEKENDFITDPNAVVIDDDAKVLSNSKYSSKTLTLDDLPSIKEYLDFNTKNILTNRSYNGLILDEDNILEVTDSIGNKNYSLHFKFTNTHEDTFFNLVVRKGENGAIQTPFIIRYVCDASQLATFKEKGFNMGYFKGQIHLHKFTDYFPNGLSSRTGDVCTPELDANGNPISCDTENVDFTGGNGGGDPHTGTPTWEPIITNPDEGIGSGGDSFSCEWSFTVYPCDYGYTYTHGPEPITTGGYCTGSTTISSVECGWENQNRTAPDPCDSCTESFDGVGVNGPEAIAVKIMKQINSDGLDPCSKEILLKLKTLKQSHFASLIQHFGSPDNTYKWEVKTETLISGNAAETDRRNGTNINDYVTKINTSYTTTATKIAISRTILHELVHAYLLSHIDNVNNSNFSNYNSFGILWGYLREQSNLGFSQDAQHQFMAAKFIPPLRDALKEWDGNVQNDQYYTDLAWGALFETDTFEHFFPQGSLERERVMNTNIAEDTNSTTGNISPKGNKCQK